MRNPKFPDELFTVTSVLDCVNRNKNNQVTSNMNISELVKPLVEMGLTVKEALEVAEKEKQRQRK